MKSAWRGYNAVVETLHNSSIRIMVILKPSASYEYIYRSCVELIGVTILLSLVYYFILTIQFQVVKSF